MIKYAVIVEPVSRNPWTEYMADSLQEAWDRRLFIETNIRGLKVSIEEKQYGEENNYGSQTEAG